MNTVDALKDLYKTLAGKDYAGDPNPTDAEMIAAIAKDATSGGGGSGEGSGWGYTFEQFFEETKDLDQTDPSVIAEIFAKAAKLPDTIDLYAAPKSGYNGVFVIDDPDRMLSTIASICLITARKFNLWLNTSFGPGMDLTLLFASGQFYAQSSQYMADSTDPRFYGTALTADLSTDGNLTPGAEVSRIKFSMVDDHTIEVTAEASTEL